ncbi:MAG: hypothetical protein N3E48_03035 [Candidatus Bathyarchaeota archaeon]|nr:hypothetical protein [Candidatus Bathyarchaeota archaeon]
MGKVITVRLTDSAVWDDFRGYVLKKYGKIHGVLGLEVTEAIKCYLGVKGSTHTHEKISCRWLNNRTYINIVKIVQEILHETRNEIPQTNVEMIITRVVGGDWRTLRKYISLLQRLDILMGDRFMGSHRNKYIFKVNVDEAKKLVEGNL